VLVDSTGSAKAVYTNGILTGFTPDLMTVASVTPDNMLIGASGKSVTFKFTIKNAMKSNG
jgi:hypothetical protein